MTTEFGGGTRFAGGFGTGHIIEDEGTPLAQRVTLNFIGTGVTATDDPANNATNVTISAGGHVIEDEGTPLAQRANLNFVGAGVTVTDADPDTVVTIPGGGGYDTVEDEGTPLAQETVLNFVGAGVTATAGTGETVVTIPGGGGGDVVIGTQQFGVGSQGIYPGISNPANAIQQREQGTFNQQVKYIAFPDGADTLAYLDWFPPQNWDAGTVKFKLYWTTQLPSVAAETIEIEVSGVARSNDDAIGAVDFGTAVVITDIVLAVDDTHITSQSASMTIAGTPAKFDWVQFKFLRDISADNMQGEVQLMGCVIEFTIDAGTSVG